MSDAGDDIQIDAPAEVEVTTDAPKGKMTVEDALQVCVREMEDLECVLMYSAASPEERPRP